MVCLGATLPELALWIWVGPVANDFERILRANQEIDKRDSYMPYIASMRLSNKSPYSATANTNLHNFVHAFGCANARERSINAKKVGDASIAEITANVAVIHYVCGTRHNLRPEYNRGADTDLALPPIVEARERDNGEEMDVEADGESTVLEEMLRQDEPADNQPHSWWKFIRRNKSVVPAYMMRTLYMAWRLNAVVRQGSLGEHFKNIAIGRLADMR